MRTSTSAIVLAACCVSAAAFAPAANRGQPSFVTQRNMFSGAGDAAPKEDDPEAMENLEKMAAAMGMSVEEYQLGVRARMRMEKDIADIRVTAGDADKGVTVERDGNQPPVHLVVTVTDDGKALGKEALEKELVAALKTAGDQAGKERNQAQAKMMQFIAEEMKSSGMA
uniref:Uncharacterized protein n=1 Tax=Odontella aurita TaxID=265563 RepID=A0A7S4HMC5_9STRA|mmetsp:Transcript_12286/g.36068  ORF Transcript_12286/g.36068 Transcript_12286/m.36068 type:complete len:169 (+) Transcript_12286:133-639(+)|eukprot:CAMPEP_0113555464 /NCGR_PEP_ID=MMETSP0015_2-20120614/16727_1 /TAXON_ID=2838 /ORGANISM="Odontella" /LENGTH=168 /DNA_ID=CAMNT_0000456735 /DNA_START=97 /DNA_END=603 /DNA_ORIENTATION=- /assembly_acc=CAM_ASM_000160